jgi:Fe-Mn family superoxide dismutase
MTDVKKSYEAKTYPHLKGLKGISDALLETHFALYAGYVKNTNLLTEQLMAQAKEGKAAGTNLGYAEMTRRLGFEYNGMILHEYYFGNLKPGGGDLDKSSKLAQEIEKSYGSVETWMADFRAVATMRGIGWAVMYQDPTTKLLSTHWVTLHSDGNPAGYTPILVMDAWEHAFVPDYKANERAKYVEAFFQNIDWKAAESRLK